MAVINLERRAVERLARELVPRFADTRDLKAKVSEIDNGSTSQRRSESRTRKPA